jgi:hypothetical protein
LTNLNGREEWPEGGHSDSFRSSPERAPALDEQTLPGDTTVPLWAMVSIVLGLLALTGSFLIFTLVGVAALLAWLLHMASTVEPVESQTPHGPFGPFGGPGRHLF